MQTFMRIEADLFSAEESGASVRERKLEGNNGADAFAGFDSNLAAVVAHDALNDHHSKPMACFFGGVVGLQDFGEVGFGDPGSGVDELQAQEFVVGGGPNPEFAARLHGFHCVFNDIEKNLFDLSAVTEDSRWCFIHFDVDFKLAIDQLGLLYAQDFFYEFNEVEFVEFRFLRPYGFQEMRDDPIQATDFALTNL